MTVTSTGMVDDGDDGRTSVPKAETQKLLFKAFLYI